MGRIWFTVDKELLAKAAEDDKAVEVITAIIKDRAMALIKDPPAELLREHVT